MVYYIGYYDIMTDGKFTRTVSPAAVRKMDYVIDKIISIKKNVTIISTACAGQKSKNLKHRHQINDRSRVVYFPCANTANKLLRHISERLMPLWLFFYCLLHIRKQDSVIYYHSPATDEAVRRSQKIKKFDLISEIEEIYSLVWSRSKHDVKNEQVFLHDCTKKAIVVSETLKNHLKLPNAIVSYGSYATCMEPKITHDPDCITLVYSGAFDKVKGGAFAALELMPHLPANYKLILSGKCSPALLPELQEKIEALNKVRGENNVIYAGLLPEEEFETLLRSADIALNLQNEGAFSGFLFPSKLLTYLCYNLPVVTTPGESIKDSCLSDILYITDSYDPKDIANTIAQVDIDHKDDYRDRLIAMDAQFEEELKILLP